MELTVITLDEAPGILPCFDESDAYLSVLDTSLLLSYNPAQVLKFAGKQYLTGAVIRSAQTWTATSSLLPSTKSIVSRSIWKVTASP